MANTLQVMNTDVNTMGTAWVTTNGDTTYMCVYDNRTYRAYFRVVDPSSPSISLTFSKGRGTYWNCASTLTSLGTRGNAQYYYIDVTVVTSSGVSANQFIKATLGSTASYFRFTTSNTTTTSWTTNPVASNASYNGNAQALLSNTGERSGGQAVYWGLSDSNTIPPDSYTTTSPTATNAGSYYLWYKYRSGVMEYKYPTYWGTAAITQASANLRWQSNPGELSVGGTGTLTAVNDSGASVSYSSSNTSVASISGTTITGRATGTTTITASCAATSNYASGSISYTLTVIAGTTLSISGSPQYASSNSYSVAIPTQSGSLTYNGATQSPSWSYNSTYCGIQTIGSALHAGTYNTGVAVLNNVAYFAQGTTTHTISTNSSGSLSASSTDTSVATVSISNKVLTVTYKKAGSFQLKVNVAASGSYTAKEITVNGKAINGVYGWADGTITNSKSCSWSIGQKSATIQGSRGQTKVYGSSDPTLICVTSGTCETLNIPSTRDSGENAGTYNTYPGDYAVYSDYRWTTVTTGTFTISKKPATVKGNSLTIKYDGAAHTVSGGTTNDLTNGDTWYSADGSATGTASGTYTYTPSNAKVNSGTAMSTNYEITYEPGTLKITAEEYKQFIWYNSSWTGVKPYVYYAGTWREAKPYVYYNGAWRES